MNAGIQVDGLKELQRSLRAVSADAAKELRVAYKDAAEVVAADARTRSPVRSGGLRKSIKASGTARGAAVKAGSARVPYAAVVHFGSPKRHIRANPFLYDAADKRRDDVIRKTERAIDAVIARHFD